MASGKLGIASPAANTWTTVYTVPAGRVATFNVRIVNRSLVKSCNIRLAISAAAGVPTNAEHIEPIDYVLKPGKILEDFGLVAGAGEIVNFYSSSAESSIRVMGFEAIP